MSLRITLRYEIPGFAFIGLVILLLWKPFIGVVVQEFDVASSVFAGFTTFVLGSPIGFLITQLWYVLFDIFWSWERRIDEDPLKTFVSYGVVQDSEKANFALNYLYRKYEKPASVFLSRRVNLYHSICSTFLALLIGFFLGNFLRYVAFEAEIPVFCKSTALWEWWDWAHLTIWISWFLLLVILWLAKRSARRDIKHIQLFVVRNLKDRNKISKLPKLYLQSENAK